MSLLFILLIIIGKGNIIYSLVASLISYLCLIVAETLLLSLSMPMFQISFDMLINNPLIRICMTLPQVIVLFVLAFVIYKLRRVWNSERKIAG